MGASTASTDGTETDGTGRSLSKEDPATTTTRSPNKEKGHSTSLQSLSKSSVNIRPIKNDKKWSSRSQKGGYSHVNGTRPSGSKKTKNTARPRHRQQKAKVLSNEEKEFQWLNWLYCQWSKYDVGAIPLSVLKQMEPAISTWARRAPLSATSKRSNLSSSSNNNHKNDNTTITTTNDDLQTYNAERAEELLERIIQEYLAGNPNVVAVTTVGAGVLSCSSCIMTS